MPRILRYPGGIIPRSSDGNVVVIPDNSPVIGRPVSYDDASDFNEFKELTAEDYKQAAAFIKEKAQRESAELIHKAESGVEALLSNANAEASTIIMAAKREAEMILTQAKATGERDGYEAAFLQQTNDISACLSEATQVLDEIKSAQEEYIQACHDEIGKISIEIANEILQHEISADPLALYDLIERAVSGLKDAKWVVLSLSKKLVPLIELLQSELPSKCPTIGHLEIIGKDLPDGSCIIDSVDGLVDSSVETQLKTLERRFAQVTQKLREG